MKLKPLKPAESRVVAVGLLLMALTLAYLLLLHWWLVAPLCQVTTRMNELRRTESHYAAVIAQQGQLRRQLNSLDQLQADDKGFLPGHDRALAAAALMQRVVDDATTHSGNGSCDVIRKSPISMPSSASDGPYQRAAVDISLRCNMPQLVHLLYKLEQGKPYLFIDNFNIYRNELPTQNTSRPLVVGMTLYGYLHNEIAPPEADKVSQFGRLRQS